MQTPLERFMDGNWIVFGKGMVLTQIGGIFEAKEDWKSWVEFVPLAHKRIAHS